MKIFALSDPHLSRTVDKPMDIFGDHWTDHGLRIAEAWDARIRPEDLVLVPGDISWAMKLPDAGPDLEDLHARPGWKLLTKGNHDLWWPKKRRQATLMGLESLLLLHGRTVRVGPVGIAASRGWTLPGDSWFTEADQKVYEKELRYMEEALEALGDATARIVMMHYPPFNNRREPSAFVDLFHRFGVEDVIHGHLHGPGCERATVVGERDGIRYHLTSCDFIGFDPVLVREVEGVALDHMTLVGPAAAPVDIGAAPRGPLRAAPFEPRPITFTEASAAPLK